MILNNCLQCSVVGVLESPFETDRSVFLPELAGKIRAEFDFVEGPSTAAEYAGPGLTFRLGRKGNVVIQELTVFQDGIGCQGLFPTEDLQAVCEAVLDIVQGGTRLRWYHNSEVEVGLKPGFEGFLSPLEAVAKIMRPLIQNAGFEDEGYGPYGLLLGDEPSESAGTRPARFVLEWRVGHAKSENIFYSKAPIPTREHLGLLERIEELF